MLPKCCGLRDVERLSHHLDALEVREGLTQGSTRILPVATETAAATLDLPSFAAAPAPRLRSEEHTSELQSLMRISYAVFCLKKKKTNQKNSRRKTNYSTITMKYSD